MTVVTTRTAATLSLSVCGVLRRVLWRVLFRIPVSVVVCVVVCVESVLGCVSVCCAVPLTGAVCREDRGELTVSLLSGVCVAVVVAQFRRCIQNAEAYPDKWDAATWTREAEGFARDCERKETISTAVSPDGTWFVATGEIVRTSQKRAHMLQELLFNFREHGTKVVVHGDGFFVGFSGFGCASESALRVQAHRMRWDTPLDMLVTESTLLAGPLFEPDPRHCI